MSYSKALCLIGLNVYSCTIFASDQPSQVEIEALKSTHSQFEGMILDDESAYKASRKWIDSISVEPSESKYPGTVVFTKEDAEFFSSRKKTQELIDSQAHNTKQEDVNLWINNANDWNAQTDEIASSSRKKVQQRIEMLYPEQKDKSEVISGNSGQGLLVDGEHLYLFISSSMRETEIKDIMTAAQLAGGTIVVRGMLPNSRNMMDMSKFLMRLAKEAKLSRPPRTITDPRLFAAFGIEGAPSFVYLNDKTGRELVGEGMASPEWIIETGRKSDEYERVPALSSTVDIVEQDIIEFFEQEYAKINWKKQKEQAVANFFKKQTFPTFPIAEEDADYELDPRIIFTKDVVSKDGTLMAKKGDVVNPLAGFEGHNRSLFIIDPRDERQKSLTKQVFWDEGVGNPTLVVSHLDPELKFKGISLLENEFRTKVYMLRNEYIDRFNITKLPIRVDIVGGAGIWIHEYGIETVQQAHDKQIGR